MKKIIDLLRFNFDVSQIQCNLVRPDTHTGERAAILLDQTRALDLLPREAGNVRICQFMHSIFRYFEDI